MNGRFSFLAFGLLVLVACTNGPNGPNGPDDSDGSVENPPNIVFFLVDDLGWQDVGFMGSAYYETPTIDRLASEGMILTQAYSNAPNCAPTRVALMSGRYQHHYGIFTVASSDRGKSQGRRLIPPENKKVLPAEVTTLAEALKSNGYATAHFGKWHLGNTPDTAPEGQGFDINIGGNLRGVNKHFSPYNNPDVPDGPDGEYLADRLTNEALAFIDANKHVPFFLYLPHYSVHTPIQAKEELINQYRAKPASRGQGNPDYAAMIESVDQSMDRIVRKLDELGIDRDTIIVFTSDNGGHGNYTNHPDLRGAKGHLHEGGIRVPTFIRWPAKVRAGATTDAIAMTFDYYPTLLEAASIDAGPELELDGRSLYATLLEMASDDADRAVYWHFPAYLEGYDPATVWRTTPGTAMRKGQYKLISYYEFDQVELYDLSVDLAEENNLAMQRPDIALSLREEMLAWLAETEAPMPSELNPDYDPAFEPEDYVTWADVQEAAR